MEIEDINDDLPTSSAAPWTKPESNPEPEVIEEQNKDKVNENKKSPIKEQKPAVSGIGNDEIQDWLLNIVEVFNQEYVRRYERGEISDKNPIIVKGPRDLEDGFVIGLAVRVSIPTGFYNINLASGTLSKFGRTAQYSADVQSEAKTRKLVVSKRACLQ